jgi:hypothetical protein
MASTQNAAMDPVKNAMGKAARAAAQDAAKTADSRQIRAAHRAGQDSRSIGVTRKAFGR